jgi:hypothetical protein
LGAAVRKFRNKPDGEKPGDRPAEADATVKDQDTREGLNIASSVMEFLKAIFG